MNFNKDELRMLKTLLKPALTATKIKSERFYFLNTLLKKIEEEYSRLNEAKNNDVKKIHNYNYLKTKGFTMIKQYNIRWSWRKMRYIKLEHIPKKGELIKCINTLGELQFAFY